MASNSFVDSSLLWTHEPVATTANNSSSPAAPTTPGTPVTSKLPSTTSGSSLVRQLFDLREKQMQQQKMLEESIHSASPILIGGNDQNKENLSSLCESKSRQKSSPFAHIHYAVDNSCSSVDATPNLVVESPVIQNFGLRPPLSLLQMAKNVPLTAGCKTGAVRYDNSPIYTLTSEERLVKPYNPNAYRSPTKDKTAHIYENVEKTSSSVQSHRLNERSSVSQIPPGKCKLTDSSDVDRPISTSRKSFEDLVIEKINADEYRNVSPNTRVPRKFLKRRAGIARFEPQIAIDNRKIIRNCSPEKKEDFNEEPTVKFPFLKKGAGNRRFNIKSVKLKKNSSRLIDDDQFRATTPTNELVLSDIGAQDFSTPLHQIASSIQSRRLQFNIHDDGKSISPIVKKGPRREQEELNAFEQLEQLAENSSFSSTTSTVNSLLQKGLDCSDSSVAPASSPLPPRKQGPAQDNLLRKLLATQTTGYSSVGHFDQRAQAESAGMTPNPRRNNSRPRTVQFSERGAQVMEYCVSDDTLTDAQSLSETSEMLNVSDLEALNELYKMGLLEGLPISTEYVDEVSGKMTTPRENKVKSPVVTGKYHEGDRAPNMNNPSAPPRHTVLHFSPPKIPPKAASYPVWQAFGQRSVPSVLTTKPKYKQTRECLPHTDVRNERRDQVNCLTLQSDRTKTSGEETIQSERIKQLEEELQSHKVLLVSKVHELENEITSFRTESSQLSKLKETVQREKDYLCKEKRMFECTVAEDKRRIEEYFEMEKNKLWREKCALENNKQTMPENNNALEIINLKEEILLLKKELDRRDSMYNFTQNKMKEKIKELNHQKKDFEQKVEKLSTIEKENMSLKHQVDRLKISNRNSSTQNMKKKIEPLRQSKAVRFGNSSLSQGAKTDPNYSDHKSISSSIDNSNNSIPGHASKTSYDSYLSKLPSVCNVPLTTNVPLTEVCSTGSPSLGSSLNSSEVTLTDGSKLITYANGNKRHLLPTGDVIQEYYNGDRKETYKDRVVYFYSESETKQTSFHSGVEELEFPDGQKEIKCPNGSTEIIFPDLSRRRTDLDGSEVYHKADGTTITTTAAGDKVFSFPNGQREVHGPGFKRREFPDGTVKVVRTDGVVETTYPNGRVRVKDALGNVLSDSKLCVDVT